MGFTDKNATLDGVKTIRVGVLPFIACAPMNGGAAGCPHIWVNHTTDYGLD